MLPFARQRAFCFALGLLFVNIPAAAISAAILRFPNSALFIRNSVFVAPLVLPLLAARVNTPPPPIRTKFQASSNDRAAIYLKKAILSLCSNGQLQCIATTLAARLATLPRTGGCGIYPTEASMVKGVLEGGGCCSDFVKVFILLAGDMGVSAREVHIPRHTTAEYWDEVTQQWIWIDPFIGYQALAPDRSGALLSHLDVYQRFLSGEPVDFKLIRSPWPGTIQPTRAYQGHLPSSYQFIFYTPEGSLASSRWLSDQLGRIGVPKAIKELALYLTVKPPLYVSGVEQNFFLLRASRWLFFAAFWSWLVLNACLIWLLVSNWYCNHKLLASGEGADGH